MLLRIIMMSRHAKRLFLPVAFALLAVIPAMATASPGACLPGGGGHLQLEISGDFAAQVEWEDAGTVCDGGPRPDGDALRLVFSRDDDGLMVLVGITGLQRGATGEGLLANITIVRQGMGRFYGTLGAHACVVDVTANQPEPGVEDGYRVSGRGRCAAGIEAIGRPGEIRVSPFEFTGLAYWPEREDDDG